MKQSVTKVISVKDLTSLEPKFGHLHVFLIICLAMFSDDEGEGEEEKDAYLISNEVQFTSSKMTR